MEYRASNMLTN